jgi:serine/threonine-protein kinase HipA
MVAAQAPLQDYVVWVALPDGRTIPAADFRLETDRRGRHRASGLRYRTEWLRLSASYPLNPVHAPLQAGPAEWASRDIPAVLDEVLPGRWERAIQQRVWAGRHDVDDLHAVLGASRSTWRVGAMEILPVDVAPPPLQSSLTFEEVGTLAEEAERVHRHQSPEVRALARMQKGSSVGGARPKVLIDDDGAWLVKFTRADDPFNHARVEHACLLLAERAGIPVPESRIVPAGRFEGLAVRRFDVTGAGGRLGLVSANALLKDLESQADPIHASYNDLADVIRKYSTRPRRDLAQIYTQMLFNECIGNRDDHLKNFSFLQGSGAFELSPAYDLVPSEEIGAYPQLGFAYAPSLPRPGTERALAAAKTFQLTPGEARQINDRLKEALSTIAEIVERAGLSERDRRFLTNRLP